MVQKAESEQSRQDAAKAAQAKAEKARQKKAADTRRAYRQVSNSEAGRIVFRDLMDQCGMFQPSVNVDPTTGEIFTDNTVYNEARRNLWLTTRRKIDLKNLVKIEYNMEAANHDDDDDWI